MQDPGTVALNWPQTIVLLLVLAAIAAAVVWFIKKKKGAAAPTRSGSAPDVTVRTSMRMIDSGKYRQRFDENYDKPLGYEWFRICTGVKDYPDYNTVSRRLAAARAHAKITQKNAAASLGISAATLSTYENGSTPSARILQAAASLYGVSADFLQNGWILPLDEHIKLCRICGEEEYLDSLVVSVRAACRMFPDLLTEEDRRICRDLITCFDLKEKLP